MILLSRGWLASLSHLIKERLRLLVAGSENKSTESAELKVTAASQYACCSGTLFPRQQQGKCLFGGKKQAFFPCEKATGNTQEVSQDLSGAELRQVQIRGTEEECLGSRTFSQQHNGHHSFRFSFNGLGLCMPLIAI